MCGAIEKENRKILELSEKWKNMILISSVKKMYEMYNQNTLPTMQSQQQKLDADNTDIDISLETLRLVVRKIGFKYKTINKRLVLMESTRIAKIKIEYLSNIKRFRKENRFICYLD